MLDEADRTGTPAYLEATSPENRRLYLRHGFQVTGELSVAGCPPLWAMWREPRDPHSAAARWGLGDPFRPIQDRRRG